MQKWVVVGQRRDTEFDGIQWLMLFIKSGQGTWRGCNGFQYPLNLSIHLEYFKGVKGR